MKELFKYIGSKRGLSNWIYNIINNELKDKQFVEMFCGNASVTFNNEIHNAWLNDLNPFNINIFNEIKTNPLNFYNTFEQESIKY